MYLLATTLDNYQPLKIYLLCRLAQCIQGETKKEQLIEVELEEPCWGVCDKNNLKIQVWVVGRMLLPLCQEIEK